MPVKMTIPERYQRHLDKAKKIRKPLIKDYELDGTPQYRKIKNIKKRIDIREQQGNMCQLCGEVLRKKLSLNRYDKENEALLCISCHNGLGSFKYNLDVLNKAIVYIIARNWKHWVQDTFEALPLE